MKATLIKTEVNYILEDENGVIIASTSLKKEGLSLSVKNCQAIELGYDLDELAVEVLTQYNWETFPSAIKVFKAGFQKALELMGDKKFSEKDIHQALHLMNNRERIPIIGEALDIITKIEEQRSEIIQSLQQTEWDVEIEMEKVPVKMPGVMVFTKAPKLDDEGCLILKRI